MRLPNRRCQWGGAVAGRQAAVAACFVVPVLRRRCITLGAQPDCVMQILYKFVGGCGLHLRPRAASMVWFWSDCTPSCPVLPSQCILQLYATVVAGAANAHRSDVNVTVPQPADCSSGNAVLNSKTEREGKQQVRSSSGSTNSYSCKRSKSRMDVEAAIASTVNVQEAFRTLTLLQLTYHLFPKPAELSDGDCFDYVIVGGGAAGCVLANRLSEQPGVSVLLLEAGGDPPIESQWPALQTYTLRGYLDWNYTTTPDPVSQRCHKQHSGNIVAGRVLGGGTAISSLYYVRGNPRDYDTWAEQLGDRNWSWDAVYPYFRKAENLKDCEVLSSSCAKYYGTGGYLGLTRDPDPKTSRYLTAVKELNYSTPLDINGCSFSGFVQQMFMIADGVRQSTAYAYLRPVKDRANLFVVRHATVYEILFDNSNRAIGVKLTKDNKNISVRARKEVILSAGTFNSPQLLMLSGIGPKEHLQELGIRVRKDLPVGFNYQNHVSVFVPFKMDYSRAPLEPTDPRRSPLFTSFVGSVPAKGSADRIEYESVNYIVQHDSQDLLQFCGFYHGYKNRLCQILFDECRGRDVMLSCAVMLYPFSRGRVTLRSANIADPPLIDAGILRDERDLERYVDYIEDTLRLVNTTLFRSMNAEVVDLKLEMCEGLELWSKPYIRCFVRCIVATLHHYLGTCAMGSVVDSELRVHGVSGLRVVDGSVMPREVGGPTTAAVIMLAEKAADIIKYGGHINVNNDCESKNSQYPQHETPQEVEHENYLYS